MTLYASPLGLSHSQALLASLARVKPSWAMQGEMPQVYSELRAT